MDGVVITVRQLETNNKYIRFHTKMLLAKHTFLKFPKKRPYSLSTKCLVLGKHIHSLSFHRKETDQKKRFRRIERIFTIKNIKIIWTWMFKSLSLEFCHSFCCCLVSKFGDHRHVPPREGEGGRGKGREGHTLRRSYPQGRQ